METTPGSPPRKQLHFGISSVCDTPLGSQEAIVERAKQVGLLVYRNKPHLASLLLIRGEAYFQW